MFKLTDLFNFFMGPRLYLGGGGGGAPAPTQTTVANTNIPEYARPYVETMLGTTQQQLYNYETDPKTGQKFASSIKGYTPFSEDPSKYVAGFSPMQEQSFKGAANMGTSPQLDTASGLAGLAGQRAMGAQYDPTQFNAQQVGTQDYTGQNVSQYMNPYMQKCGGHSATRSPAPSRYCRHPACWSGRSLWRVWWLPCRHHGGGSRT